MPSRFSVGFHVKVRKVREIIWLLREPSAFILEAPVPFQVILLSFQTQHLIQVRLQRNRVFFFSYSCYSVLTVGIRFPGLGKQHLYF